MHVKFNNGVSLSVQRESYCYCSEENVDAEVAFLLNGKIVYPTEVGVPQFEDLMPFDTVIGYLDYDTIGKIIDALLRVHGPAPGRG